MTQLQALPIRQAVVGRASKANNSFSFITTFRRLLANLTSRRLAACASQNTAWKYVEALASLRLLAVEVAHAVRRDGAHVTRAAPKACIRLYIRSFDTALLANLAMTTYVSASGPMAFNDCRLRRGVKVMTG
jgi:hypothetical protein